MSELNLEQMTVGRRICPECIDIYERIGQDIKNFDLHKEKPKEINYSQLIRIVGISSFPIIASYYLGSKFSPQIIEYIQSVFN